MLCCERKKCESGSTHVVSRWKTGKHWLRPVLFILVSSKIQTFHLGGKLPETGCLQGGEIVDVLRGGEILQGSFLKKEVNN